MNIIHPWSENYNIMTYWPILAFSLNKRYFRNEYYKQFITTCLMESQHTVKIVGRGAYGVVYLCLDKDGRNYITKHIPVSDMSPTERQSAMNEVSSNSLLLSPLLLHHIIIGNRNNTESKTFNLLSFKNSSH